MLGTGLKVAGLCAEPWEEGAAVVDAGGRGGGVAGQAGRLQG